jgi:hypothetical protein
LAAAGVAYLKIEFERAVAWCGKKTGKMLTLRHIIYHPVDFNNK